MTRKKLKARLDSLEGGRPQPGAHDLSGLMDHELARLEELLTPYPDAYDAELPPAIRDEVNEILRRTLTLARAADESAPEDTRSDAQIEADLMALAERLERENEASDARRAARGLPVR